MLVSKNISIELRKIILDMVAAHKRGHIGSAMSLVEVLWAIYEIANINSKNLNKLNRDRIILSKGHGCLALYAILIKKGFIKKTEIAKFCQFDGILGGHPEKYKVPGIEASTGSLGHGLAIGVGMAVASKINKLNNKIYVILGDGEINEGSIWESALSASKHNLNNLIVIIDHNKMQSYGSNKEVLDLEPLKSKWKSFGFNVNNFDAHNLKEIKLKINKTSNLKPNLFIANSIKGKGLKIAENNPLWHHKNNLNKEEIKNLKNSIKF